MIQRNLFFDFLRGIAIILVIAIHTFILGENSNEIRQLLNTAVPLFVAISGFFLSRKRIQTKPEYQSFLKHQLPKVYIPVLVWSLPLLIVDLIHGDHIAKDVILFFACGYSIYYFVAFIMQCYIMLPLVTRLESVCYRGGLVLSSLLSISWIALVVYFKMIQGLTIPLILYAGLFPCWIMFFVLGVALGQKTDRKYKIWMPVIITLIGLILSVVETHYLYDVYGTGVGIKPSAFVYSFGAVVLLFSSVAERLFTKCGFIYRAIVYVGKISFGIYLTHCYVVQIIKHFDVNSWPLRLALTLSLTIGIILLLQKLIPSKYHKYLGI